MVQLLVIADDFTGALDTGVQFSASGAYTEVVVGSDLTAVHIDDALHVLVVDAETRHCCSEEAYSTVYGIVKWAIKSGVPCIYKKTDSALRGNIGSELEALLCASGETQLPFVPAFPKLNRCTRGGIHFVDNLPVSEGAFGQDPYEPVKTSVISEIIAQTSTAAACSLRPGDFAPKEGGICIYDAENEEDLKRTAANLPPVFHTRILAGCAGFAALLPALIGLSGTPNAQISSCTGLLAVCGSLHPVSISQCDYAERHGAPRIRLSESVITDPGWAQSGAIGLVSHRLSMTCDMEELVVLDTASVRVPEDVSPTSPPYRCIIRDNLGLLLKNLLDHGLRSTIFIMGGDSLLGLMKALNVNCLNPVCEVAPGIVLSAFYYQGRHTYILSKSGGFGSESLFIDLQSRLVVHQKEAIPS